MSKISIVTAYRKDDRMVVRFLNHMQHKLDKDLEWEIIVVNNFNSNKIEHEILSKRIDLEKDSSFVEVFNSGIKEATGDYVIVCNSDAFIDTENFGKILIKQAEESGAWIIQPDLNEKWFLPIKDIPYLFEVTREMPNYFWFIPRDKLLLFDERFKDGLFFEDYDYCREVFKRGGKLFVSGAVKGVHYAMGETKFFSKDLRLHNRQVFFDKWGTKCPDWEAGL